MQVLVVESETAEESEARRRRAGKTAGESFAVTLRQLRPGSSIEIVAPADPATPAMPVATIGGYDAVFVTGSPLHVYEDKPEVRRQLAFMRAVFASGAPSFGSCAGLQLAVAAAGGTVRSAGPRREAGIARGLTATAAGRMHPLLAGRPPVWDAFAIHGDEVAELPPGATLLATNGHARVQAAEVRYDRGVFWGVQYHPELAPGEIAVALQAAVGDLVSAGVVPVASDVAAQAELLERLEHDPDDAGARWRLGVSDEIAVEARRRCELDNFLAAVDAGTLRL